MGKKKWEICSGFEKIYACSSMYQHLKHMREEFKQKITCKPDDNYVDRLDNKCNKARRNIQFKKFYYHYDKSK